MNILLINHYAGSPKMGMEFRPYYMAREWQKKGNNVLIVTSSFSHTRKIQFETEEKYTYTEIDGIKYFVIKTPKYSGNGFGRIKNMASFIKSCLNKSRYLAETFKPDIVIASSTYPLDNYPARKICKLSGAKMIYEVHDLWPLSPKELGGYSKYHPFIMIMQAAENFAYKHCNAVVSLLPKAKEHMIEHGLKANKFYHIPNGFDPNEWNNPKELDETQKSFFNDLQKKHRLIIGYAGGHNQSNNLNTLIEAVEINNNNDLCYVLVGKGNEKPIIQKKCIDLNLTNVYFLDPVEKQLIPSLLNEMDVLFLGWARNPLYRFGISPNKLIDYMMAGEYIIHAVDAGNDMVKEAECGISIEPENPEKLAEAFNQVINTNKDELSIVGAKGKAYIKENFTYEVLSQKFLKLMEKLITEKAN